MNYPTSSASFFSTAARGVQSEPEYVLAVLKSTSDGKTADLIVIYFGEKGYHRTNPTRATEEWVAQQNALMGVNPAIALAFEVCSLTGNWTNYKSILQSMQEKMGSKEELCSCCDPIHPGDDDNCPIHGKGAQDA